MSVPAWLAIDAAALAFVLCIAFFAVYGEPVWGSGALAIGLLLMGVFVLILRADAPPRPKRVDPAPAPPLRDRALPTHASTGLYRWWVFRDRVAEEIARAERGGRSLSLLLLEPADLLDGPPDDVRAEAARQLRYVLRAGDFAAQLDGERFLVMLPETERHGATAAGRRLLAELREAGGASLRWRAAIVAYPEHGDTPDALVGRAQAILQPGRLASALRS